MRGRCIGVVCLIWHCGTERNDDGLTTFSQPRGEPSSFSGEEALTQVEEEERRRPLLKIA